MDNNSGCTLRRVVQVSKGKGNWINSSVELIMGQASTMMLQNTLPVPEFKSYLICGLYSSRKSTGKKKILPSLYLYDAALIGPLSSAKSTLHTRATTES